MKKKKLFTEPSAKPLVADIVHKNIKKMLQLRKQNEERRGLPNRIADKITQYIGSISFAVIHLVFIFLWVGVNSSWSPKEWNFDPSPYTLLSTVLTVEALFMAIFILMNQNEMKDDSQNKDDLNIQIDLLTEHEVTKIMSKVEKIYTHLEIKDKNNAIDPKVETSPEKVLQVIEQESLKMVNSAPPDLAIQK